MNKVQFLYALDKKLSDLPEKDRDRAIEYYSEMIDDRIEDGISEADAVASLSSIDEIYLEIVSQIPIRRLLKFKFSKSKAIGLWKNLLMFFGFLVFGLPILAALFAVTVSVYATIWIVVIVLCAITVSLASGGVVGVILYLPTKFTGTSLKSMFILGAGIFSVGLVFPFYYLSKYALKFAVLASKWLVLFIKKSLIKNK